MNWKAILAGAVSGAISAAGTDFGAFRSWKSFQDAARYDWPTAIFRWVQGAILGALGALGLGQVMA